MRSFFLALVLSLSAQATNWPTYGGYPLCSDVIQARVDENVKMIQDAIGKDEAALARLREFELTLPGKAFYDEQAKHSDDLPPQPLRNVCFWYNTPIQTLLKDETIGEIKVDEVKAKSYLLSSTVPLFKDRRYQVSCWDVVEEVISGVSRDYVEVNVRGYKKEFTVRSTPKHRFYANDEWKKASDLKSNDTLFGHESVTKVIATDASWEVLLSHVYNFKMRHTKNYFIGPKGEGVLVHNAK